MPRPLVCVSPSRDLRDARALNGTGSGPIPIPLRDRIIATTEVDENGCWIWQLNVNELGRPTMMVGKWYTGKVTCQKAYRIAYQEFVGPVPDGLELDHLCRVPRCCNPAHLEPVTHRVNAQRGDQGKWQRDKTHCPQGHAYDAANTYMVPGDRWHRRCRTCLATQVRKRRAVGRERGGVALAVLATVAGLVVVAVIVVGGYQLGWWLRAQEVNRSAEINRQSFEVQQTYREKALDGIADVRLLDSQIADPAYADSAAQLRAQRTAMIRQTCDGISRLTTSGAGVDPDIQSFHDTECAA